MNTLNLAKQKSMHHQPNPFFSQLQKMVTKQLTFRQPLFRGPVKTQEIKQSASQVVLQEPQLQSPDLKPAHSLVQLPQRVPSNFMHLRNKSVRVVSPSEQFVSPEVKRNHSH